jgi:hypothetical protein
MVFWVFATAGLFGILCGCLFRAPALVFLSFLSFGGALVLTLIADLPVLKAFMTAILITAALQLGYLVGAGLCYVRHQYPRSRGMTLGANFQRRSYSGS